MSVAAAATSVPRELYGHLLPLQGVTLLLPKLGVLEILGMDAMTIETSGPNWLLGFGEWRDRRLPVLSLEAMAGNALPTRTRRSRLAVINSLGEHLDNGLFMIVTQGYPQLTALNAAALQRRPDLPQDADLALSRVRLATTDAIIPDLEAIERRVSEALEQSQGGAAAAAPWEIGDTLAPDADDD